MPVTFESLLDIAAIKAIAPPTDLPVNAALLLPIEAPLLNEQPSGSLAAILSFLPEPINAPVEADDGLDAQDAILIRSDQEPVAIIAAPPAQFLPLPLDLQQALPVSLEPRAQSHTTNEPGNAIQIIPNPRALPVVTDVTIATNLQQPTTISSSTFNTNTQQIFADRQLDFARNHLWLNDLASDIVAARDALDKVSFRLLPPHLGQLDVEILGSDKGLIVNLTATTQEAAKIIATAQPRLIDELLAQGMRVNSAEISHREMPQQMPQNGDRQPNAGPRQIVEFDILDSNEAADDETERPLGRFA